MADKSAIEWTDATWNPTVGCSIVSPGCTNCYAMRQAERNKLMARDPAASHYFGTTKVVNGNAVWTGKLALAPERILTAPLRWRRPRRIFVNSMSDLFHESVPDAWIDRVFAVMALCPQHTFQVLTKRSARMRAYFNGCADGREWQGAAWVTSWHRRDGVARSMVELGDKGFGDRLGRVRELPLPNVWLGVSAEDQRRADERVPDLLATPAAIRFVSAEPLLGPIDFRRFLWVGDEGGAEYAGSRRQMIQQIIVGGESGPGARPMHPEWARAIGDQCGAAGIAFFFKQWGAWSPYERGAYRHEGELLLMGDVTHGEIKRLDAEGAIQIWPDGRTSHVMAPDASSTILRRVGKRHAGRLLDGAEHNGMPEVRT